MNNGHYSFKRDFENTAEQDEYFIRKYFKKEYHPQTYQKYAGPITIDTLDDRFRINFDSSIIILDKQDQGQYLGIFRRGFIYPKLLDNFDITMDYSIRFYEITYLKKDITKKRYRVIVGRTGNFNPWVYLLEIVNSSATENTNLESFINNSEQSLWIYWGMMI